MRNHILIPLVLATCTFASETVLPEYEQFSPEWFYTMGFVDAKPSIGRRGLERFFQRDWNGASGLTVGSGVRVSDQRLALGAIEFARAADHLVDGSEDSARAALERCSELAASAADLAEDISQHLRSTVLHARCLALLPDRGAAARVLAGSTRGMDDPADIAEYSFGAGNLLEDMGRNDSALVLYRKAWNAQKRGPFAIPSLEAQISVLLDMGRPAEVTPLLEEGRRLFPADTGLQIRLRIAEGRVFIAQGDTVRGEFRWKVLTNAFANKQGEIIPDSVEAAEIYWRLGALAAERAAQHVFQDSTLAARRAAHASRRELMETSFGYYRQAVACYSFPWTPLALRDIAGVIERYAMDVASQRIDFQSDTDRVAQEVVVQKKLPALFKSAASTYRRQIRLAQATGDGMGIGLQSGKGLARSWWNSVAARRNAAVLLENSPRPRGDSAGLAWYERVVDSAINVELTMARRTAQDGLADMVVLGQGKWPEVDSLRAFLGSEEAGRIEKDAASQAERQEVVSLIEQDTPTTAVQWLWRSFEARRLARNTAVDIRLLKARLGGR